MNQEARNLMVRLGRDFYLLWVGKIVSQMGDKMYMIALAWWVLEKTGSSALMGALMALSVLPGLLLGVFIGPWLDRANRKTILVVSDLVRGVVINSVAALEAMGMLTVEGLMVASVVSSLATAFFDPTSQAIIPQIVGSQSLQKANSLNQVSNGLTMVLGPVCGAMVLGLVGFVPVFFLNAVSYIASAMLEGMIRLSKTGRGASAGSMTKEIQEGLNFLNAKSGLRPVIVAVAVTHFFVGIMMVCQPLLAKNLPTFGLGSLGLLQGALGLGMVLGSALSGFRKGQASAVSARPLYLRIALFGAVFLCLATGLWLIPQNIFVPIFLSMVFGSLIAQASISWSSTLQLRVPQNLSGRVFSVSTMAGNASLPLAFALGGSLLGTFSIVPVLAVSGILLLVVGLGTVSTLQRWPISDE